jgi:hypothetical protein
MNAEPAMNRLHINGEVEHEALARVIRGESQESVVEYLKAQGTVDVEIGRMLESLTGERVRQVRRAAGFALCVGTLLMILPVALGLLLFGFQSRFVNEHSWGAFILTLILGAYGVWLWLKGLFFLLAPHLKKGPANAMFGLLELYVRALNYSHGRADK